MKRGGNATGELLRGSVPLREFHLIPRLRRRRPGLGDEEGLGVLLPVWWEAL